MTIYGKVVKGLGIGTKLGYPTANLEIYGGSASGPPEAEPPAIGPGVYAARATYEDVAHDAAVVIGAREDSGRPLVEVLLLDFTGDLYGKELTIELFTKVSAIERCADEAALQHKIEDDVRKVRLCLLESFPPPGAL